MGEPDITQHHRAVANVLWAHLKHDAWKAYREVQIISPTGNPSAGRYASAHTPRPDNDQQSNVRILSVTYKIITTLWSDDWHGGSAWRIRLDKNHAEAAVSRLNSNTIADYETALEHSNARKPFTLETTEDGGKRLTRNRNDGLITNLTAAALEAVARACELELIPAEIEDALLTDSDINLDAIRAALQLAGGEEP